MSFNEDLWKQLGVLKNELGIEYALWSADNDLDVINNKEFSNRLVVILEYNIHWGKSTVRTVRHGPVTYQDVWKMCDELIVQSDDLHHVFVEKLRVVDETPTSITYELITGS